jgi:hypothetical protein
LANETHLKILAQGAEVWNAWRKAEPDIVPDLVRADLSLKILQQIDLRNANLTCASLNNATLRGADLRSASLIEANLLNADLTSANLSGSYLSFVDFNYANLTGADLRETDLRSAVIRNAELDGADFSGATMGGTLLANLDMSGCKGLETVIHTGPSAIGIDTIYRSKGNISDVFLRRAGVPKDFITYIHSSGESPIKSYYTCFISHSSKDRTFCDQLNLDLNNAGVGTWYYEDDARGGKTSWEQIEWAIKKYDKFLLVCSENSLTSGPVIRELNRAIAREDEEKKGILFPITIDGYVNDKWVHARRQDVINYHVLDFTGSKAAGAEYDARLKGLLSDLAST